MAGMCLSIQIELARTVWRPGIAFNIQLSILLWSVDLLVPFKRVYVCAVVFLEALCNLTPIFFINTKNNFFTKRCLGYIINIFLGFTIFFSLDILVY